MVPCRKLPIVFCLIFTFTTATHSYANEAKCNLNTGDKVVFQEVAVLFDELSLFPVEKGEFETTGQFEKRKKLASSKVDLEEVHFLEGTYDINQVTYDADNEEFVLTKYAWSNIGVDWDAVFPENSIIGRLSILGFGLRREQSQSRTYQASNALGVSVTVAVIERLTYAVFDRRGTKGKIPWKYDLLVPVKNHNAPAIRLPSPPDQARNLKNSMRVGVAVRLKPPFVARGSTHYDPSIELRIELFATTNVIFADILCAIITNDNGTVLKIVETAY